MVLGTPFVTTTRCLPGWPIVYSTYHQEVAGRLRRCERARVIRLGRRGLVVGRWHSRAADEMAAIRAALDLRPHHGRIGVDGTFPYSLKEPE